MNAFALQDLVALVAAPFLGSFLSVLAIRLPRDAPWMAGRSCCLSCGAKLQPIDLIPLVSWVMLAGRCRRCRAPIGWLYPFMELGALGVALWAALASPPNLVLWSAGLGWLLLVLSVIDARDLVLPDLLTLATALLGAAATLIAMPTMWLDHLIGGAAGFAALAFLGLLYRRLRGREGLGLGDAKLLGAGGLWLGWEALPGVMLIAAGAGLGFALARAAWRRRLDGAEALPFGPCIAAGIWLSWLYGPLTLAWPGLGERLA